MRKERGREGDKEILRGVRKERGREGDTEILRGREGIRRY